MEFADDDFVEKSESNRLKKIHACVNRIKYSEEVGVKFMQKWIERIEFLEEGRAEGRADAIQDSLSKLMQKQNLTAEEALELLEIPKEEWTDYIEKLSDL